MKVLKLNYNQISYSNIKHAICIKHAIVINNYYIRFIKNSNVHNEKFYAMYDVNYHTHLNRFFYFNNLIYPTNKVKSIKHWKKICKHFKRYEKLKIFL